MRALVIEDDPETSRYICDSLRDAGFQTLACNNAQAGLAHIAHAGWDVLILDRLLPGAMDGLGLLKQMRAGGDKTPVIVLSALNGSDERILGLRSGADDYLPKPFVFSELLARIESLLRRAGSERNGGRIQVADLVLDRSTRRASRAGKPLHLQLRKFRMLEYLMLHEDQVVTRAMLLEKVWNFRFDPQSNITDVQISRLRNKVDKGFPLALIHTVRGIGYRLSVRPHGAGEDGGV